MKSRKLLVYLTALVAVIGIIFFITPFILSLKPSKATKPSLFEIDISGLDTGSFIEVDDPYGLKILILKDWDNSINAYLIPFNDKENIYMLPDINWMRPFVPCKEFGPETTNGKLIKNGQIRCFDETLSTWWKNNYKWNYSGKNLGNSVENLPLPKYVISYDTFILTGRGWIIK